MLYFSASSSSAGRAIPSPAPALLYALAEAGGDADALVRKYTPHTSAQELQSRHPLNVHTEQLTQLYSECVLSLERHACALDRRPTWPNQSFKLLCQLLIGCPDLSEALARCAEFFEVLAPQQCEFALSSADGIFSFQMNTHRQHQELSAFVTDLVGMSNLYKLFSWLIGENIPVVDAAMTYSEKLWTPALSSVSAFDVRLSQPNNQVSFSAAYLARKNIRSTADLDQLLKQLPGSLVFQHAANENLTARVRAFLRQALKGGEPMPDLERLAKIFDCSVSTLCRRFQKENIFLHHLKDECRHELATGLLRNSTLTVEEIALRTGFSGAPVFGRAFKKWTGLSPSEYRKLQDPA